MVDSALAPEPGGGPPCGPPPVAEARSKRLSRTRAVASSGDLPALVSAARRGDADALDSLVRATYAGVYGLAFRLTGNDDDAKDVVQEAYLRAHRSLPGFRGDAQFTTWLYRITANCASTVVRKRRRTRTEPLADDAPIIDHRVDRDPEWHATAAEDRTVVAAALAALPGRLRRVIVLRDIYDLPHRAIAEELGISEAAAKVRLHRARRRLKDAFEAGADLPARRPGPKAGAEPAKHDGVVRPY